MPTIVVVSTVVDSSWMPNWRAVAAYAITGVPAAALGARTLLVLPPRLIECALGIFFLLMIPARRLSGDR